MGLMTKRTAADRRKVWKGGAFAIVALFAWSFVASPNPAHTIAAEEEVTEPSDLTAYNSVADAAPIRGLIQHNAYLVTVEPAIARSTSEVALPSQATSTSWLASFGTLDGAHGTTTGNKVPTEATASQPGGDPEEEFKLERGSVGNDALLRYGSGVSRATAFHGDRPRGYGYGYLAGLSLLPAPGSAEAPPGTYDPAADAEKERERPPSPGADDPRAYTPNPGSPMGILTVGSAASTAETFREDTKVISIAVAELNGINIGNRTGDGRCTNCITIDSMRVEARTESDGTPEGALASYRILIHRACRIGAANDAETGNAYEGVTCLDPMFVESIESAEPSQDALVDRNARGIRKITTFDEMNKAFAELAKGLQVSEIGIFLNAGTDVENVANKTPETAYASARGLILELKTTAAAELAKTVAENDALKGVIQQVDGGCAPVADAVGEAPATLPVPVPRDCASAVGESAQQVRTLRFALGQVASSAQAIRTSGGGDTGGGGGGDNGGGGDGGLGGGIGGGDTGAIGGGDTGGFGGGTGITPGGSGGGNTYVVSGLQAGPLKMRINWAAVGVKPWRPKDMAKGFLTAAMAFGVYALIRRRLRPSL